MHPELEERQRGFEAANTELRDLVAGLADESFNRWADAKRCCVAECGDHLTVIGEKLLPASDGQSRLGDRSAGHLGERRDQNRRDLFPGVFDVCLRPFGQVERDLEGKHQKPSG